MHILKLLICVCCSVWRHFQQSFSHITTVSGCDRELNVIFYSAASLWYQVIDTVYLILPTLTLHWHLYNQSIWEQHVPLLMTLVCHGPGSDPVPPNLGGETLPLCKVHWMYMYYNNDTSLHVASIKRMQPKYWWINLLWLHVNVTVKFLNFHTRKLCCKPPKIQTKMPNLRVFYQNDANGIANSGDPDQTAPLGAVWSGSALFAQTVQKLGSLPYN